MKIADFGIAKILDLELRDLSLTGAKDVVGTPHYMAPEQIEKPQTVDCRADIYSLGVVFYEMLTGELPLGKFPPPSQKAPVDGRLDHVVLHALEKEPAQRYQNVTEVKTDLETIATTPKQTAPSVNKAPIAIGKPGWWKKGVAVGIVGLFTLAAVLVLGWLVLRGNRPVAWWRAEGGALDSVGTNNGVLVNNVKFADGLSGKAFLFDGDNAYVKIPPSPQLNPAGHVTVEFWMKADANSLKTYAGLVAGDFYLVEISSGSQHGRMGINFAISTDKGETLAQTADANNGGAPISADEWHLITGVYNGRELRLFIDGRLSGEPMPHAGTISPMLAFGFLTIGSEDGRVTRPHCIGTRYFSGLIDEVKIYNLPLSAKEIEAHYHSLKHPAP